MHERDILLGALELTQPLEREAYLAQACGTDSELRGRVDALLRASEAQDSFLERPAFETDLLSRETDAIRQKWAERDELSLDFLHPSDDPQALGRLGPYEVMEAIGRGGMGVVLKARDTKLHRVVAIKVLAPELASNPTARKRFQREAHAAAAVVHQHVVTIHAVDEDRLPYLVMECIAGQSLQEKIDREGQLQLVEILRIGQQVASGLAAAHAHGLIHRDVKPANILLENGVERVRITDFGLARAVDDVGMTRTGEVAGTPQYMSPEQAQGLAMDARSDLFSFGCVLYAMCTGRPPFRAETAFATARRVCEDTPRPIREVNPEIPDWLVAIIDRLLAKKPPERFQTAAEVADLLGQHLADLQHPVRATGAERRAGGVSPLSTASPQGTYVPRSPRLRWTIGATAAVVLLLLAVSLTEATGVTQFAPTVIRIVRGEGTLVIDVADPTVEVSLDGEELSIRGAGLQELRLLPGKYRLHATKDGQPVKDEIVTITRDGRKVVTVSLEGSGGSGLSGGAPSAQPTAAEELKLVEKLGGHTDVVNTVAFLPDERMVSGSHRMVRVWDLPTRSVTSTLPFEGNVLDANVSANGRLVAVLCNVGGKLLARVWDIEKREVICEFAPEQSSNIYMRFSPDGKRVVTNSAPSPYAILWDVATGKELERFDADDFYGVTRAAFSPDGRLLAVGAVGRVQVFDIESKGVVADVRLPNTRGIWDLVFAPSGKALATGQAGGHISIIALDSRRVKTLQASDATVRSLRFLGNDTFLLTSSYDATLRVWDLDQGRVVAQAATENGTNHGLFVSPDGRQVITAGGKEWDEASASMKDYGDYALRLWQLPESVWPKESGPTTSSSETTNQIPKLEAGAFVVLGGAGVAEWKFDTLAEAVLSASDGDTIEVRGNGPFVTDPVNVPTRTLTIRAGRGFLPVIRLSPQASEAFEPMLSATGEALTLEGLEFQRLSQRDWKAEERAPVIISTQSAALHVANCRFVLNHDGTSVRTSKKTAVVVVRYCELFSQRDTVVWFYSPGGRLTIDNSVHLAKTVLLSGEQDLAGASIALRHNTMLGRHNVWLDMRRAPAALDDPAQPNPIRVAASSNLFDAQNAVLQCDQTKSPKPLLDVTDTEAQLRQTFAWQDDRNLYPQRRLRYGLLGMSADAKRLGTTGERDLAGWQQFWGSPGAEALSGHVRYEGMISSVRRRRTRNN